MWLNTEGNVTQSIIVHLFGWELTIFRKRRSQGNAFWSVYVDTRSLFGENRLPNPTLEQLKIDFVAILSIHLSPFHYECLKFLLIFVRIRGMFSLCAKRVQIWGIRQPGSCCCYFYRRICVMTFLANFLPISGLPNWIRNFLSIEFREVWPVVSLGPKASAWVEPAFWACWGNWNLCWQSLPLQTHRGTEDGEKDVVFRVKSEIA